MDEDCRIVPEKNTLSLVVITYNEENNLDRCLTSVKGLVDDIVILDSGSSDGTAAIARKHNARWFTHTFDGHIEQKNRALTFVNTSWVLSLDADEALDEQLYRSIKSILASPKEDGYTMNRLTNYCGHWVKYCGWYPDQKLRLWKHRSGEWCGWNPHDRFELQTGKTPGHLQGDILHYSYHSVEQHRRQALNFAGIAAVHLHKRGVKIPAWQIPVRGLFRFVRDFIFKKGFLDGKTGFVICRISAWSTYKKYAILHELKNEDGKV